MELEFLSASSFITKLVDDGINTPAFFDSTFDKDFILLAEFCELEGPKPIFTIPATLHSTFNLNTFAVRIMSVDCVSIMQTTDFSNFTVAGDIQVVLTEMSEGAVAYVHHFVLYDICARGFVRPFCLAYITKHHSNLMSIFERLKSIFSMVSMLFHFGNALSFINDIMLRLHHLVHLKNVLTDQVCDVFVDDVMLTEPQKKGITNKALDEAMKQLEGLMEIFQKYVEENTFDEHRELFSTRYNEMMQKVSKESMKSWATQVEDQTDGPCSSKIQTKHFDVETHELMSLHDETSDSHHEIMFQGRPTHRVPSDVISSILGKKYDKRLRSLNELCDITCNVGLDVLKYFLHVFTTKDVTLLNNLFVVQPPVLEQATCIQVGTMEFPMISQLPDLNGVGFLGNARTCGCSGLDDDWYQASPSIKTFLSHFVNLDSKHHRVGSSSGSHGNSKSVDVSDAADGGIQQEHLMNLNHSFLSLLKYTSISLPAVSSSATSTQSKVGSFVNIPLVVQNESSAMEGSGRKLQQQQSGGSNSSDYQDALDYPESVNSSNNSTESMKTCNKNMFQSASGLSASGISVSGISTESVVSVDGVKEKVKATKVSLLKLREKYSFILPHVVYSLFIGRPLVIAGEEKDARKVSALVYALANFLPTNSVQPKKVYPWFTKKLSLKDLKSIGIVGMPKASEGKNPVPLSLRCYVSLLDYTTQVLHAPFYYGNKLAEMFDTSKQFDESTFRKFIAQMWSKFVSEAYVRFVNRYTEANLFRVANASGVRPVQNDVSGNPSSVKPASCDFEILMYFVEMLKKQLLLAFNDQACLSHEFRNNTIRLNNKKCQAIPNSIKRKR